LPNAISAATAALFDGAWRVCGLCWCCWDVFLPSWRHGGSRDLENAWQTDKLDPYWRLEDLEARRRPMPDKGVNGFDKLWRDPGPAAQPWPQPSFPQFDNDRDYQPG